MTLPSWDASLDSFQWSAWPCQVPAWQSVELDLWVHKGKAKECSGLTVTSPTWRKRTMQRGTRARLRPETDRERQWAQSTAKHEQGMAKQTKHNAGIQEQGYTNQRKHTGVQSLQPPAA